ncbi:hypothetical protein EDD15DRAFT_2376174 [Pisolithus albus]|nr:hypothetical protein EDD15DRAFT_2376174 [Pisolithus albus]
MDCFHIPNFTGPSSPFPNSFFSQESNHELPPSPLFTPPPSPSLEGLRSSSLLTSGDSSPTSFSDEKLFPSDVNADDEDSDFEISEYEPLSDEHSEHEPGSADGDHNSLLESPGGALRSKRARKGCEAQRGPPPKKIRMQAPKGSRGYPTHAYTAPTRRSGVPVPYCTENSHVDASRGCPSTPITKCAILHKLRMYFGPYGFVCEKCSQIYPPSHLRHHITTKHKKDLDLTGTGNQKKQLYNLVVQHLLTAHAVPEDVVNFDLPEHVSDTIPGLTPVLSYRCAACQTARWFCWKTLLSHYRKHHQGIRCPQKQDVDTRYIMRPYRLGNLEGLGGRSELSDTVILLPRDWSPTNSRSQIDEVVIPRDRPLIPANAPHLVAIGWPEYLESLMGTDIQWLIKLVEMPKQKVAGSFPPKRAALERGILLVDALLLRYLTDADAFLASCHPSVRKSVTSGTRAHYRSLTRRTYVQYRAVITKTLCMLLRVEYFSRLKDRSHMKRLGNFSIASSRKQASATRALYNHLISADGEYSDNFVARLPTLIHDLLVSLVQHMIHGTRKMECPTDQSLFLLSIRFSPTGALLFHTANQLTRECATMQYWFFTTVVHIARLEAANHQQFVFFSNGCEEAIPVTPEELPENSDDVAAMVSEVDMGNGGETEEEEEEEEEEGERECGEEEERDERMGEGSVINILSVIHREKERWLRPTPRHDYFTPYDRFKSVWYDATPTAFKESSKIGHGFQPDGTAIVIDAAGEGHCINLVDIGKEAHRILMEAEALIYECLPEETCSIFSTFQDLSQLSDDLNDPASIFRQRGNAAFLRPSIVKAEASILQHFNSEEKMLQWLQNNDRLLSLFLTAFALTCSIPPRAFQFASLQYDRCPETGSSRGLFLIDGTLAIGKPAAKQSGRSRQDCLWFLPSTLASSLTFYLAILRPVVVKVLTRLRKEVIHQDTYIFCRTIPRTAGCHSWNGDEITKILQRHTKPLNIHISTALLRQLYTAFFRQYFPGLCGGAALEDSLVDRQGQHRFYTGKQHYGQVIGSIPRSLGIDLTEARKLGAMSQLLHIVFGLRSPDEQWRVLLEDSHFLPSSKHDRHALDTARVLVLCNYGISSGGTGPPAALRAQGVLEAHPYFGLPTKPGESFGDAVLIQVFHAYLFGDGGPRQFDETPPGGYHVADAARAIVLIIQAVEEWANGNFQPTFQQFDLQANSHFKAVQERAEKSLLHAKNKWPEEWRSLCKAVRTYRPSSYRRVWSMRGLPDGVTGV